MCVKGNSSMFDARHELYFLEFVFDMNASSKSNSVKKAKNKEEWKPTGKVFTKIGYNQRPTGRTFTLVGNACPLTRITATNKVPLREPIPLEVVAQESVVTKVYTRRPKVLGIKVFILNMAKTEPKAVVNVVRTNRVNAVKASACWIWRPVKPNSASITLKRYDYVEARGNPETELEDSVRLNSPEDKKRTPPRQRQLSFLSLRPHSDQTHVVVTAEDTATSAPTQLSLS
ncbi:hypothetical protein Tco_0760276 [Tanacetum coccineum]